MNKTFSAYYQNEKELLDESLQHFSRNHPEASRKMGLDSPSDRDPHIERLLEGCTHLTARIKQQIDLGLYHLYEAMLRKVLPNLLKPSPSMTMIEFCSPNHQLSYTEHAPAGVTLMSDMVGPEYTHCIFKTIDSCKIHPVTLQKIDWLDTDVSGQVLTLSFHINESVDLDELDLSLLPIYINASHASAANWHYYLTRNVSTLELVDVNDNKLTLGSSSIRAKQWDFSYAHEHNSISTAIHHFRQCAHFPQSHLFFTVDLSGLSWKHYDFTLCFHFTVAPDGMRIKNELFKINCIPALNVFEAGAEPIRTQPGLNEYPLLISHDKPDSQQFYDLLQVQCLEKNSGRRLSLSDFYKPSLIEKSEIVYRIKEEMKNEQLVKQRLVISGELKHEATLSCSMLCSNGHYPNQYLSSEDLYVNDRRISLQIKATNLIRPCLYRDVRLNYDEYPNYLSMKNMDIYQLSEGDNLKNILVVIDDYGRFQSAIEAMDGITLRCDNRISKGIFEQQLVFTLCLQKKDGFDVAQANFFGNALYILLKSFIPIHLVFQLKLILLPRETELIWSGYE